MWLAEKLSSDLSKIESAQVNFKAAIEKHADDPQVVKDLEYAREFFLVQHKARWVERRQELTKYIQSKYIPRAQITILGPIDK
jgi:hypothetical protein